ncbi:AraC family transcriptional regulator [Lysobacter fragariae]
MLYPGTQHPVRHAPDSMPPPVQRTISSHFVRACLHGARRRGVDISWLLGEAGISPDVLHESRARISFEQFARLIQVTWRGMDDESLGFGRRAVRYGSFAMMCNAIIHCRSLEAALRRSVRFYALLQDHGHVQLRRDGERASIVLDLSDFDDPDHFFAETLLVIWHRLSSWLVGQRIPLIEASFAYPSPAHRHEYDLIFGAPLRFDEGATAIVFHSRHLDMPLLQDEASLRVFLQRSPYDLLSRREHGHHLSARVRRMFSDSDDGPAVDLDAAAARLAMSPQSLRRHLQQEGNSFQSLKDHWRRDLAVGLLAETTLSIAEIARRTGFSEPSTFHRAFRKWTGLAPSAYRDGRQTA